MEPTHSQLLRGRDNSRQWKRDFKVAAQAKGVQDIFNGVYEPTPCPDPQDYNLDKNGADAAVDEVVEFTVTRDVAIPGTQSTQITPTKVVPRPTKKENVTIKKRVSELSQDEKNEYLAWRKSAKGRSTLDGDAIQGIVSQSSKSDTGLDFSGRLALYKFNLDEYDKGRRLVSTAMALLVLWVSPALRGQLEGFENPKTAYDYLMGRYRVGEARAREMAVSAFEKIHITQFRKIQDYLNVVQNTCSDIKDAGGSCTETQVVDKVISGLEPLYPGQFTGYEAFLTQLHMMQDIYEVEFDFDQIVTQLLTYESMSGGRSEMGGPRQRMPSFRYSNGSNNGGRRMYNNDAPRYQAGNGYQRNSNNGQRERCSGCGNQGHNESNCWTLHPELRPQNNNTNRRYENANGYNNGARPNASRYNNYTNNNNNDDRRYNKANMVFFDKPSGMAAAAFVDEHAFVQALRKAAEHTKEEQLTHKKHWKSVKAFKTSLESAKLNGNYVDLTVDDATKPLNVNMSDLDYQSSEMSFEQSTPPSEPQQVEQDLDDHWDFPWDFETGADADSDIELTEEPFEDSDFEM